MLAVDHNQLQLQPVAYAPNGNTFSPEVTCGILADSSVQDFRVPPNHGLPASQPQLAQLVGVLRCSEGLGLRIAGHKHLDRPGWEQSGPGSLQGGGAGGATTKILGSFKSKSLTYGKSRNL